MFVVCVSGTWYQYPGLTLSCVCADCPTPPCPAPFCRGAVVLVSITAIVVVKSNEKVCEMWWTQERPGAEHLVSRLLPMMLVRSVDVDAKEADVKRMFGCAYVHMYTAVHIDAMVSATAGFARSYLHRASVGVFVPVCAYVSDVF